MKVGNSEREPRCLKLQVGSSKIDYRHPILGVDSPGKEIVCFQYWTAAARIYVFYVEFVKKLLPIICPFCRTTAKI